MRLDVLTKLILANIHTLLFLAGITLLVVTVFLVNTIAGLFTLSGVLVVLGLLLSNTQTR